MTEHAHELRRHARKIGQPAGDTPAAMESVAAHIEDLERRLREAEARVTELEAERAERERQGPDLYVQSNHFAKARFSPFLARVCQQPIEGIATAPFYAAPPVTAPVRLTDKQIAESHANEIMNCLQDPCDKSESVMPMPHDVNRFVRAIETAVLRANGFKVEG